jgi:type IV pilus assembly protein PilA
LLSDLADIPSDSQLQATSEIERLFSETTMPSSNRRGFTLIELLIVVVIIGVLAAIAVPKFQNTKGKANAASLRADLRNLVTAEEAYFYDNSAYTTDMTALNIRMTTGVTVTFGAATAAGWSAKVTHPLAFPIECAIFFGSVAALPPASNEGLLACS